MRQKTARSVLNNAIRVNQKELAARLQITDRRVRQLEELGIIVIEHPDEVYDLELNLERYSLYKNGDDEDWREFYAETDRAGIEAKHLFENAMKETATVADIGAAARASNGLLARMRFITGAREKEENLRMLFMRLWQHEDDDIGRQLFSAHCHALGRKHGVTADIILAKLREDLAKNYPEAA